MLHLLISNLFLVSFQPFNFPHRFRLRRTTEGLYFVLPSKLVLPIEIPLHPLLITNN